MGGYGVAVYPTSKRPCQTPPKAYSHGAMIPIAVSIRQQGTGNGNEVSDKPNKVRFLN